MRRKVLKGVMTGVLVPEVLKVGCEMGGESVARTSLCMPLGLRAAAGAGA